jgi:hypothetical protein
MSELHPGQGAVIPKYGSVGEKLVSQVTKVTEWWSARVARESYRVGEESALRPVHGARVCTYRAFLHSTALTEEMFLGTCNVVETPLEILYNVLKNQAMLVQLLVLPVHRNPETLEDVGDRDSKTLWGSTWFAKLMLHVHSGDMQGSRSRDTYRSTRSKRLLLVVL